MIKKLLCTILITLLFATNVFASGNTQVNIELNGNTATVKITNISEKTHGLQLDLIDENGNTNIEFKPNILENFTYSFVKNTNKDGKTTISLLIDSGNEFKNDDNTLNIGTLKFEKTPKFLSNATLEVVDMDTDLQGKTSTVNVVTENVETSTETTTDATTETTTNNSSSNNSNGSIGSGSGANIGTPSDNKTEGTTNSNNNNKPTDKPNGNVDIDKMYPVIRQSNFSDTANHWANEPIKYLADRGIINGMDENTFAPNNNITRAEFITLLAKMDNIDVNKHKAENFKDVSADAWYNPYVDWAAENGITSGITADTFAPNANITREQMAVMIERFCNYKNFSLDSNKQPINFTDNANISNYASSSVSRVQQAGIINGRPDGSFSPKANATRGESAQMIYTMLTIQ